MMMIRILSSGMGIIRLVIRAVCISNTCIGLEVWVSFIGFVRRARTVLGQLVGAAWDGKVITFDDVMWLPI